MQLEFYKQGESKGLYDELFTKYNELLEEVQELRQRAPAQQARRNMIIYKNCILFRKNTTAPFPE